MSDRSEMTARKCMPEKSSPAWRGSVTAEMIAVGRLASLNACHGDAPIDLQIEAMYRAMRALEEPDVQI